jgi:hypothetical protein
MGTDIWENITKRITTIAHEIDVVEDYRELLLSVVFHAVYLHKEKKQEGISSILRAEPRIAGDPQLIRQAALWLSEAKSPFIVVGSGAFYARAGEALDAAAERMKFAREAVQSAQVEAASLENERRHTERLLSDAEAKRGSFTRETASIEESLRASLAHLGELESTIAVAYAQVDGLRNSRGEGEVRVQAAREKESAALDALNEIKVVITTATSTLGMRGARVLSPYMMPKANTPMSSVGQWM